MGGLVFTQPGFDSGYGMCTCEPTALSKVILAVEFGPLSYHSTSIRTVQLQDLRPSSLIHSHGRRGEGL